MTIERTEAIYNADTGETRYVTKSLEFIQSQKPETDDEDEEVLEETETQLIQHWVIKQPSEDQLAEAARILLGVSE